MLRHKLVALIQAENEYYEIPVKSVKQAEEYAANNKAEVLSIEYIQMPCFVPHRYAYHG